MKKLMFVVVLLSLPTFVYAVSRCGAICSNSAKPMLEKCKQEKITCESENDSAFCAELNKICLDNVHTYQMSCLEDCIRNERGNYDSFSY